MNNNTMLLLGGLAAVGVVAFFAMSKKGGTAAQATDPALTLADLRKSEAAEQTRQKELDLAILKKQLEGSKRSTTELAFDFFKDTGVAFLNAGIL